MLKNKSKDIILEEAYRLNAENQHLLDCLKSKDIQLKSYEDGVEYLMESFIYKYVLRFIPYIKHFVDTYKKNTNILNQIKMTQFEILESLEVINKFEKKQIPFHQYKKYIESHIKTLKSCTTCGSTNNKFHQDFQKKVFSELKNTYPDLLPKITFKSHKYASSSLVPQLPYYTYENLQMFLRQMIKHLNQMKSKGYNSQIEFLNEDIQMLKAFVEQRLDFHLDKLSDVIGFDQNGDMYLLEEDDTMVSKSQNYTQISDTLDTEIEAASDYYDNILNSSESTVESSDDTSTSDVETPIDIEVESKDGDKSNDFVEESDENIKQNENSENNENIVISDKKIGNLSPEMAYKLYSEGMSAINIGKKYNLTRGHVTKLIKKFANENGIGN